MKKADNSLKTRDLCDLFSVPVSSYYYQPVGDKQAPAVIEKMKEIHQENFQSYGRRRMQEALAITGCTFGVFKISRLMNEAGIVAKVPRKRPCYPTGTSFPAVPNDLNRQFNPEQVNTHWVGDITYIRHHQGWSYLATVLDLGSREIVGYALSQTPDAVLPQRALSQAIKLHRPDTQQLLFHSDQGVQYRAALFKHTLSLHGIKQSMSRRGNCWDNAVQERFFRSLKSEYLNDLSFINHASVINAVERYIRYYNNRRINSAIGNITPVQKRQTLQQAA